MEEKKYHHGNLKQEMIKEGIKLVTTKGDSELSLRKIASICGVSASATYSHFKDKEELINEMKEYVTNEFYKILEDSVKDLNKGDFNTIINMGEAYVNFFIDNPTYFKFLFFSPYLKINLSLEEDNNTYPPFRLFREYALDLLSNVSDDKKKLILLTNMWATVQGISLLATSSNVVYAGNIREDLKRILTNS